jgi:1-acyl-sn-glycerol-3-phosphate acyltransferase
LYPPTGHPAHAIEALALSRTADRAYGIVETLRHRLGITIQGLERIPKGRALFVGNHAFGWDILFAMSAVRAHSGRRVWVLGEHVWRKVPILRRIAALFGTVDGTQHNADRLLASDELVFVLPGGLREAVKPRELRYRLLWGQRYGFVRLALRHGAPIVPIASIGTDELWDFVGNPYQRGRRWLGLPKIPVPLPARVLPIPHLVRTKFVIGEPIAVAAAGAPSPADELTVRRLRREAEGALHELFEQELAGRAGMPIG